MAHAPIDADGSTGGSTPPSRGLSVRVALLIALLGAAVTTAATVAVLRNDQGTAVDALLGVIALGAFGVTAYGLMQAIFSVIDSAGERRRRDREVTERRKGARARQPKP